MRRIELEEEKKRAQMERRKAGETSPSNPIPGPFLPSAPSRACLCLCLGLWPCLSLSLAPPCSLCCAFVLSCRALLPNGRGACASSRSADFPCASRQPVNQPTSLTRARMRRLRKAPFCTVSRWNLEPRFPVSMLSRPSSFFSVSFAALRSNLVPFFWFCYISLAVFHLP